MVSELSRASQFVRNAAFLRREFLGRNIFSEMEPQTRERTLYFFDTDIVVTFCEPWLKGPSRKEGGGDYGVIFPPAHVDYEDQRLHLLERDRAAHIAAILAEYVFQSVRSDSYPAYQFDEHFSETARIYKNARSLAKQVEGRQRSSLRAQEVRMRRTAALLAHRSPISGDNFLMPEMVALLQSMTPLGFPNNKNERLLQSWERFVRLNNVAGGIYPAHLAAEHFERDGNRELTESLRVLSGDRNREEEAIYRELMKAFEARIAKHSPSRREVREHDAKAIINLYILNARLKNQNTGWRAIFITGAQGLAEACYGRFPNVPGVDQEVADKFSQKFVRHLWAYTTEALLEPEREGRRRFINWLDGLLASEALTTRFNEEGLTDLVLNPSVSVLGKNGQEKNAGKRTLKSVLQDWNALTEQAVAKHRLESLEVNTDEALRLQHRIVSIVGQWYKDLGGDSWENLIGIIREEYHRAKDRTFLEFSSIGKDAIFQAHGIRQRNPPDLAFASLPNTNRIFQRLLDVRKYSSQEFSDDYKAIAEDCRDSREDGDDRQLSHLRFLVLGAAFAAANKWGVALSQGKRAISIIERSRSSTFWPIPVKSQQPGAPKTFMSGREAYFLCASATRVIAATADDLDAALELLRKSEGALAEDKEHEGAEQVTYVRFKCERLALALTHYYLERKRQDKEVLRVSAKQAALPINDGSQYCDELVPNIYHATRDLLNELREVEPSGILLSKRSGFVRKFSRATLVNVATNIIQACVIRAFRRLNDRPDSLEFPLKLDDLHQALAVLAYFSTPPPKFSIDELRQTPLIRFYRDAGARILDSEGFSYHGSSKGLLKMFEDEPNRLVTFYDGWRFEKLEELGNKLNGIPGSERRELVFGND